MENIFENSDFVYMLNQAAGDRQILAQQLNISPHQLSYVTHSGEGEGLLFYGNVILPFVDHFPTDLALYKIMTTKLSDISETKIIRPSDARPGDLIFFQNTYNTSGASHVGIYVGNGMMIHCGNPISYASVNTSYWQEHFYCYGRIPN